MRRTLIYQGVGEKDTVLTISSAALVFDVMEDLSRRQPALAYQFRFFADGCVLSPTREIATVKSDRWTFVSSPSFLTDCRIFSNMELLHGLGATQFHRPCESLRPVRTPLPVMGVAFTFELRLLGESVMVDRNLVVREDELGALVPHRPPVSWYDDSKRTRVQVELDAPFSGGSLRIFFNSDVLSAEFAVVRQTWQRRRWVRGVLPVLTNLILPDLAVIVARYDDWEDGPSLKFASMRTRSLADKSTTTDVSASFQLLIHVE